MPLFYHKYVNYVLAHSVNYVITLYKCIYANMSTRMRESVQTDVEYLHNVRMRDVEEAQQRIVSIIRRLEDEGTLVISKGNKEDEIIA